MGGWQWGCGRQGGDGSPHARGQREWEGGSLIASTWESPNTTGGERWFPNRPYEGVAEHDEDGRPRGVVLRRRQVGRDVDREEEGRFAYPPLRLVGSWEVWRARGGLKSLFHKSSPMIYAKYAKTISDDFPGENMEYGPKVRHSCESRNPEGPILGEIRLLKQALKPAPTEKGLSVGGVGKMDSRPRLHGGRLFAGKTEGGMGPRIREDKGRGGRFANPPLRGSHPTSRRRATTRSLFHKSSPMIYAKYAKTISDSDLPGENMEYGPKVCHSCESRNPEGPILGEVRLLKQAPRVAPTERAGWT